ncbi:MAG: MFS transporter [Thermoleophilia bacterium]
MSLIARPPCDAAGVASGRGDGADCAERSRPWALAATVLGSSMAFIDGSALTVALPALRSSLGADLAGLQWVIGAYVLALAAFTLIGGALADRYGRRLVFATGCAVFAAASLACALAPTLGSLVAARFAQGVGAALLTPSSLALISSIYPRERRGAAIGIWAAASAITAAAGPVLGGWLTQTFGWQAIFFLNLPLAVGAIVLALRHAPVARVPGAVNRPADWIGAVLAAAALGALAWGLVLLGEQRDASVPAWAVWVALGTGALLIGGFALRERAARAPMMPLRFFESREFTGLNLATLLLYAALSTLFFLLPFELIETRGFDATEAGLALLPFTLAVGLLSRSFGALADRIGARLPLAAGAGIAALGYAWMAGFGEAHGFAVGMLPGLAALGLGFALLVAPLTAAVLAAVADDDEGTASGINNTASRIAQLVGAAGAAAIATASDEPLPLALWLCTGASAVAALVIWQTVSSNDRA